MARKIRVGLIGLGAISYAHEAGYCEFSDACEISALCDINREELEMRMGMYPNARGYTNYEDLLNNQDLDMVDIVTPHQMHYSMARSAIEAGKHVLVEKPIAVDSRQGQELISLASKKGIKFSVAENTRFVKAYLRVENILREELLGDIWTIRSLIAGSEVNRIRDPLLWHGKAPYGGVILDSAVHNFYLYKWLFGGIADVQGFAWKKIQEGEAEDNGLILGHTANGAEYQLNTSCTMEIPWTERLEIYGSKGGMIIDQLTNPVIKYYLGSNDIDGSAMDDVPFDPLGWKFNSMVAEIGDFISSIIDDRDPLVNPQDALYALRVVEFVQQSIKQNQIIYLT